MKAVYRRQEDEAPRRKGWSIWIEPARTPQNIYTRLEWAGAFGDIGTLIPFLIAYITIVGVDPLGLLFTFGIFKIIAGFYYKTPVPIQPMKAIGAAAVVGCASPATLFGAGLITGLFWLILGATGMVKAATGLAGKPVVRGIMLGLGLSFIVEGIKLMRTNFFLAGLALILTYLLLTNPRIPAMFVLLIIGVVSAIVMDHGLLSELAKIKVGFKLPAFAFGKLTGDNILEGVFVFALPQIPLTLGNAVVAITAENNELFPGRPVTEKKMAISTGIMNIISPFLGGVPMCHGAGGMAGHVRFGARTGGALVLLGTILIIIALFFSDSVSIIFKIFPAAVLGVILFFAGAELALTAKNIGDDRGDFYVMLVVAGFAMWNMGVAFLVGVILHKALKKGWIMI
ncbi:MAG: putative sulfate/molybdate transporter [Syntrophales bacterium]|nr:putative sulfate/molybdate transporter [Syntrophales bacterium]